MAIKKKVVVGMSGGVDSSVAALLLKQQGYEVLGLFMNNWEEKDNAGHCSADKDFEDVRRVCGQLDIPYYSVNYSQQYLDKVFATFLKEYSLGRTPNPDVLCNREVKFGPFLEQAMELEADYIATGHYAGIEHIDETSYLTKAVDSNKDQTYFLHQLSQRQLQKVLFPLTNLTKPQVRQIAIDNNLYTAKKSDSMGICFIGERKFRDFLSKYLPNKKGKIVDLSGKVVGEHLGLMYYTLGQRRGLGIGGRADEEVSGRWFVADKDMSTNQLIVSHGDESVLNSVSLLASEVNFIPSAPKSQTFQCMAKFRYRQAEQAVTVEMLGGNRIKVTYAEPQRAVTPGQYVVLYDKRYCLGGGVIDIVNKK